jgi:hypothetical protein
VCFVPNIWFSPEKKETKENKEPFEKCCHAKTFLNSSGSRTLESPEALENIGAICEGLYPARPHPIAVTLYK